MMQHEIRNPSRAGRGFEGENGHVWSLKTEDGSKYFDCQGISEYIISVLTSSAPLTKRFSLKEGKILRSPGGHMSAGQAERVSLRKPSELVSLLTKLTTHQAVVFGSPKHQFSRIVSQDKLGNVPNIGSIPVIARTAQHFAFIEGQPGIMMLDYDPPKNGVPLTRAQFLALLTKVWPEFEWAPIVICDSASSHIWNIETGEELIGHRGLRIYVFVADASDIPRAGKVLFDKLWLAGHGRVELSAAGTLLLRGPIDIAVHQPERLDFAAGADCEAPLQQRRPGPEVRNNDAPPLDTKQALLPLTPKQEGELSLLVQAAKEKAKPAAARMREQWLEKRVDAELSREGMTREQHLKEAQAKREQLTAAALTNTLSGNIVLYPKDLSPVTVAEMLADPDRWDGVRLADPLEPGCYDDDRIALAILKDGAPRIFSHAHGGQVYRLGDRNGCESGVQREDDGAAYLPIVAEAVSSDKRLLAAKERFPRTPVPWQVLPDKLTHSLQQLARSCATSPSASFGQVLCMVAAAVGRKFCVSPKKSWNEPIIFWLADIRASGAGKTALMHALAHVIRELQAKDHERAEREMREWETLPPADRKGMKPPVHARGYFTSNMTLEGLHADLNGHPSGGILVLLSELSAFIASQGEYKAGKGTDRESWLCLHDGNAVRITRKSGSAMIRGARVQVCGGIQPSIFGKQFAGQDGTFLQDGTIFRLLVTYEPVTHYQLTDESWTTENSAVWEGILRKVFAWSDRRDETLVAELSQDAKFRFFSWRNEINARLDDFPPQFRGYLPKAYGYALRLAGGLHLLDRFSSGLEPCEKLNLVDIERGISAVEYYLGQALDALRLVIQPDAEAPSEVSTRSVTLARVLDGLRSETCNGKLAVGYIQEKFNELARPEEQVKSAHAMGGVLRACGVPPGPGKYSANGRRASACVSWSETVEQFIKTSLQSLHCLQTKEQQGIEPADIEKSKSALSAAKDDVSNYMQTLQTLDTQSLHPGTPTDRGFADKADKADKADILPAQLGVVAGAL